MLDKKARSDDGAVTIPTKVSLACRLPVEESPFIISNPTKRIRISSFHKLLYKGLLFLIWVIRFSNLKS
jgi:hypothetical protein